MSDVLGLLHLLIGLVCLVLAVLVPSRASTPARGVLFGLVFLVASVERFIIGSYRLIGGELSSHGAVMRLSIWAAIMLMLLLVMMVAVLRTPQHNYGLTEKPPDE